MTPLFRITHIQNLPFILRHGLHCPESEFQDTNYVSIGFPTLIEYRKSREVPVPPYGTLSEYVAFYFWYRSPMLYVIYKGNNPEVIPTDQQDIVYLVSSIEALQANNCRFVFTDRHAQLEYAAFYNRAEDLNKLSWEIIKSDQWGRQYGPDRMELKQAECLVHRHVPLDALLGIAVMNPEAEERVKRMLIEAGINNLPVKVKRNFYF